MRRTVVRMKYDDSSNHEWREGEAGYIDGYTTCNGTPMACVVLNNRIVICRIYVLEVIRRVE